MNCQQINICIPTQVSDFAENYIVSSSDEDKMKFVIDASRASLAWEFGGPFAAAIFRADNHHLVALGVNLIINQRLSTLHAEMVAIMVAQRNVDNFDLGGDELPPMELFTSTEPCTMCLGASHWSGVNRVVSAATDADAKAIGFDEGPKPNNWALALSERGIDVRQHCLRKEANEVLQAYANKGGRIYNSLRNA